MFSFPAYSYTVKLMSSPVTKGKAPTGNYILATHWKKTVLSRISPLEGNQECRG